MPLATRQSSFSGGSQHAENTQFISMQINGGSDGERERGREEKGGFLKLSKAMGRMRRSGLETR